MGAPDGAIIGTNAGIGTLTRHLAPSRALLLVRGDRLPRAPPAPACRCEE